MAPPLHRPDLRGPRHPNSRAFALVSVLIMVVLLTFVLVALLSLLRMENQAGGNTILRNQAQQNALVAMDLALAELQGNLGPDQRVSATASFLDSAPETEIPDGVSEPHWTGVWDSQRWDGGTAKFPADYYDKSKKFRKWLVSAPNGSDPLANPTRVLDTPKVPGLTDANSVILVGQGTVRPRAGGEKTEVRAWLRDGDVDNAGRQGRYAWWVGDEGVKARLNLLPHKEAAPDSTHLTSLAAAPRNALEAVEGHEQDAAIRDNLTKTLTFGSLPLAYENAGTAADFSQAFHDFTVYSTGVQADVQRGGLKKDLSLALEMPKTSAPAFMWDAAQGCYKKIYSRTGIAPTTPGKTDPNAGEGPDWGLIHRQYSLYRRLKVDPDGVYSLNIDEYNRAVRQELNRENQRDPRNASRDYVVPLMHKMQLVFGAYKARRFYWANDPNQPEVMYLSFYPALNLWNPYNIRLRTESDGKQVMQQAWHISPPPFEIGFGGTWKKFKDIFWVSGDVLVTLSLGGAFGTQAVPLVMEPGAFSVYGPEQTTRDRFYPQSGGYDNSPPGMPIAVRATDMRTGWDPLGPFHSNLLGPGAEGTATDSIKVQDINGMGVQLRPLPPAEIHNVALGRTLEDENDVWNGFSKFGRNPDFCYNMVGTFEINSVGDAINTNIYKSYPPDLFPQLTGSNLSGKDNPYYLFSYDLSMKIFPDETEARSKYGFITDPTELSYLFETQNPVNALSSPFEVKITPLTGGPTTTDGKPHVKVDPAIHNRGYLGDLSDSIDNYTWKEIPTLPMISLGQLQHVPLGIDYGHPIYTATKVRGGTGKHNLRQLPAATFGRPFGNSYSHPRIALDTVIGNPSYDHCIHANYALADGYFFSTIAPQESAVFTTKRPVRTVLEDWLTGKDSLLNPRLKPYLSPGETSTTVADMMLNGAAIRQEAAGLAAAKMLMDGSFNINSLSEEAWVAILGGNMKGKVPYMLAGPTGAGTSEGVKLAAAEGFPISRVTLPNGQSASTDPHNYWKGYVELEPAEIRALARNLVVEIKKRGPFLNLADFLTRKVDATSNPLNLKGAVQSAIDATDINQHSEFSLEVTSANLPPTGYTNTEAALGPVGSGIPGYITQADVLTPVMPYLAARSDTFTIRSYGEVTVRGKVQSRAWCEAVVQRTPEYVDPADKPEIAPAALTSDTNKTLGRRFRVVQFRWLSPDEV